MAGASAVAEGWALSCRVGLGPGEACSVHANGWMRPACVDTCESVRLGPREGMLAGGHMYVDKGRWTYPDLVPLRAAKLEIELVAEADR